MARKLPGAEGRPQTCTTPPIVSPARLFAPLQTVALSMVTVVPITAKLPPTASMAETAPRSSAAESTCCAVAAVKSLSILPAMRTLMPICSSVVSSRLVLAVSVL